MLTGEVPDPAEVFTVLKLGETKVAFKSGYGKYLSVDMERRVVGRSEAISNREQFEPVFQEVCHYMGLLGRLVWVLAVLLLLLCVCVFYAKV